MAAPIAELQRAHDPDVARRVGIALREFLAQTDWPAHEARLRARHDSSESLMHVTIRSDAPELHLLPWELIATDGDDQHLGALERVVLGHAWTGAPESTLTDSSERVLFAWSTAGGPLPAASHQRALSAACERAGVEFLAERDVIAQVSAASLDGALRAAQAAGRPVTTLHLLCHGEPHEHGHGLLWNDSANVPQLVTTADIEGLLSPYASGLRVVVLAACHGADPGPPGGYLGPITRALHRIGIPWVIGSRYLLSKPASLLFCESFYPALLDPSHSVESALALARRQLMLHSQAGDWAGLQLHARACDRALSRIQKQPSIARLWSVPALPVRHLERAATVQSLVDAVRAGGRHGIHGMAGAGKSVLAANAVRQPAVRSHFEGIYWLQLGQQPDVVRLQAQLARALGMPATAFANSSEGRHRLSEYLSSRRIALVLDDVWQARSASALDVVGPGGCLLVLTRDRDILTALCVQTHPIPDLSLGKAKRLLATWAGVEPARLPASADDIIALCGRLPLALAMVGGMLASQSDDASNRLTWRDAHALLASAELADIGQELADHDHSNLLRALASSVHALPDELRCAYLDLAVLPPGQVPAEDALAVLWSMSRAQVRARLRTLSARSLVAQTATGLVGVHQVQRLYLRHQLRAAKALANRHGALADALIARCPHGIERGPCTGDDLEAYFYRYLPYHLQRAGRLPELLGLLGSYDWLSGKVQAVGVTDLVADYAAASDSPEHRRIGDALRLSSPAIASDAQQLAGQLVGRLGPHPPTDPSIVGDLLQQARQRVRRPWLCPMTPTLTPPGGPLFGTLFGHSSSVRAAAIDRRGVHIVSSAEDATVRYWHGPTGALLHTLSIAGRVSAIALTDDGQTALLGTVDGDVVLWCPQRGQHRELLAHDALVLSIASPQASDETARIVSVAADGVVRAYRDIHSDSPSLERTWSTKPARVAAIGRSGACVLLVGNDNTLSLWNLHTGQRVSFAHRASSPIQCAALDQRGDRAVTGAADGTVALWNCAQGTCTRSLPGHVGGVWAVAWHGPSRVLSAGEDRAIRAWDSTRGALLGTHQSHTDTVWCLAASTEGERVPRVVSGSSDGTLRLWHLAGASTRSTDRPRHRLGSVDVAISADAQVAMSVSRNGALARWDPRTGRKTSDLTDLECELTAVAITADGSHAYTGDADGAVHRWRLQRLSEDPGQPVIPAHPTGIRALALGPDGQFLATGTAERLVRIWNLGRGALVREMSGHRGPIRSLDWTPDGQYLLSAADDDTVRLWHAASGALAGQLSDTAASASVAISPSGQMAACGHESGALALWSLPDCHRLVSLETHRDAVMAVAWLDDAHVLSAGYDRVIQLHAASTGQRLAAFTADQPLVSCAAAGRAGEPGWLMAGTHAGHVYWLHVHGLAEV